MKAIHMTKLHVAGVLAASILALAACGKKDESPKPKTESTPITGSPAQGVQVATIVLGDSLGPQKKVTQPTDSFGKKDTIYASVDTTGAGTAVLKAKWTFRAEGSEVLVREDSQTVSPTGPATSEFHVSKPDGWPSGSYRVDISLAGNPAGSKSFTVK
jgi:hypothetical protein